MSHQFIASQLEEFIGIEDIPQMLMTPRIGKMKNVVQELNDAGLRQTLLYTNMAESLNATLGEPQNIRRAKALVYHLEHIGMPVFEAEQVIGSVTGMWPVDEERNSNLTYEQLKSETIELLDNYFARREDVDKNEVGFGYKEGRSFEESAKSSKFRFGSLMARDHYDANIGFQDMQQIIDDMTKHYTGRYSFENWEIGAAIEQHFQYNYGEETMNLLRENGWNAANHTNLNYQGLVKKGISGILSEIEGHLKEEIPQVKRDFYISSKIVMEGVSNFIQRYAESTAQAAEASKNATRKNELAEMANVMKKVSVQAPATFTEAIELVWLFQMIGNLFGGSALSLARFDQYMFPFYKRDIEAGTITVDRVRELVCSLYLKLNEPKMRTVQSLCVGGVHVEDGSDACNDLSKICLEVMSMLKLPYPNMSARISYRQTPEWFYEEIVRTVKAGCGQPMILNDEVWVPNLTSLGMPVEWARDYYNMGCTEIMIQGKDSNWTTGGLLLLPLILNNMIAEAVKTGKTYDSFQDFLNVYLQLVELKCDESAENGREAISAQRRINCDPFASALIDGCLENGVDYFKGGSCNGDPCSIMAQGLGTAADSLSVIHKYVFEQKKYDLAQICDMLDKNFEGYELQRLEFMNNAPSFGNDDDYVDELAKTIFDTYSAAVRKQNENRLPKTRFVNNVFSYNMHITLGESLGATANGRLAGEAISDCAGPSQGRDCEGSTALLNSAIKLSCADVTGAHALNFKISPSLVKDMQGNEALITLLRVYLKEMGPQIQINYQNPKDLMDAQIHPEKHRDLVVRIAGYCEYFVNLDHRLQSEIIERTIHEVA